MPAAQSRDKALTYSRYLRTDELLGLQTPLSAGPEHDEMLFIIIHQVYELWFKQVIHELGRLQEVLETGDTAAALATLKRILTIFKTLVAQVDILETMTPVAFNSFRARLESASGFQSAQFREVEFLLGHKNVAMARHHPADSSGGRRLQTGQQLVSVYLATDAALSTTHVRLVQWPPLLPLPPLRPRGLNGHYLGLHTTLFPLRSIITCHAFKTQR